MNKELKMAALRVGLYLGELGILAQSMQDTDPVAAKVNAACLAFANALHEISGGELPAIREKADAA